MHFMPRRGLTPQMRSATETTANLGRNLQRLTLPATPHHAASGWMGKLYLGFVLLMTGHTHRHVFRMNGGVP